MINIKENQRVMVWTVEDKGKYSLVRMTSSRKDKSTGNYKYSNWSFVRFVGDAYEKSLSLKEKEIILLKGAGFYFESYEDSEGVKKWPKQPNFVVFNFDLYNKDDEENTNTDKKSKNKKEQKVDDVPEVEEDFDNNNDDLPF